MPKRRAEDRKIGTENLVGQNMILLRKRVGINQNILLSRLQVRGIDISQTTLSAIEGQNRKVYDKELVAIADALGVSLETLFHPDEEEAP